jgi:hypothetical protein
MQHQRTNLLETSARAEAGGCATLRVSGTAPASGYPRARALRKVRTPFEDAHAFSKVRILENPDDFFEDAQPFPRCAQKTVHLGTLSKHSDRGRSKRQRDLTRQRRWVQGRALGHGVQGGALVAPCCDRGLRLKEQMRPACHFFPPGVTP